MTIGLSGLRDGVGAGLLDSRCVTGADVVVFAEIGSGGGNGDGECETVGTGACVVGGTGVVSVTVTLSGACVLDCTEGAGRTNPVLFAGDDP